MRTCAFWLRTVCCTIGPAGTRGRSGRAPATTVRTSSRRWSGSHCTALPMTWLRRTPSTFFGGLSHGSHTYSSAPPSASRTNANARSSADQIGLLQ